MKKFILPRGAQKKLILVSFFTISISCKVIAKHILISWATTDVKVMENFNSRDD